MPTMTLKDAAQFALDVQTASNLSGVVTAFANIMGVLNTEARAAGGTAAVNTHPVSVLFATQIAHLTGLGTVDNIDVYVRAYDACVKLAAGG